ncbi:hypothetical protein BCV69DRAFT_278070 [Microstroma glucosiphilum]|uniref:HSF-type DNA-binding domain-containing protein n=1 Tax=Pseudomicrostroma glucosiphilum TaxID=1684307 RepID=A0A316U3E0_9BASI|nr:hypothetical protein BCV69DRAFT_278070 [Pseudomicrostroma glucosiphilum]PWN19816.1 hypothetical protein BCV69DRAFT_278070 [Pseudomicrostroma glucosiphilum]
MAATINPVQSTDSASSTSSTIRAKSPLRQNGFAVAHLPSSSSTSNTHNHTSGMTANGDHNPTGQYLSRSRTTTGSSTITLKPQSHSRPPTHSTGAMGNGGSADSDGDVEMEEGGASAGADQYSSSSQQPLPIPRVQEPRSVETRAGTTASQTPSDLSTPPDVVARGHHGSEVGLKTPSSSSSASRSGGVKLPPLSSMSPSFASTHRVSAHWSPSRGSDPHLYSISSGSFSYSSVKPYLSTSFRTSAERSGSAQVDDQDDEDLDDDVFGHTSGGLVLQDPNPGYSSRGRARGAAGAPGDLEGEGDMAGVFSFSSPYLRPQSADDHVPGLPPSPPESHARSSSKQRGAPPPDRVLSPSWTAKSLQRMTIGGGGVEMTPSTSVGAGSSSNTPGSSGVGANRRYDRTARPSHMHHPHSYAHSHSAFSKSLPSGSAQAARRLSSSRLPRPAMPPTSVSAYSTSPGGAATFGSATLYSRSPSNNSPYARSPGTGVGFAGGLRPSPYHTSSSSRVAGVNTTYAMDVPRGRERSRSRQRWAIPRPEANRAYGEDDEGEEDDDDETDDEMMLPGQVDDDIDVDHDSDARTARPRMAAIGIAGSSPRNDQRRFAPSSMPNYAAPVSSNRLSGGAHPPSAAGAAAAKASYASEVDDDGTGPAPDEMTEVSLIRDRLGGAANCAAFIAKLWFLVTRPGRYGRYLHWNTTGSTVILTTDPDISNEFASEVLPRLWNHANYSSFIRQMNLYGFQRLPSSRILEGAEVQAAHEAGLKAFGSATSAASSGGEQTNSINEFSTAQQLYGPHSSFLHPKFVRGREDLLPMLKPRNAKKPKAGGGGGVGGAAGAGGGGAGGVEGGDDE